MSHHFRLGPQTSGGREVLLDGVNVAAKVNGVEIVANGREPDQVVLHLSPAVTVGGEDPIFESVDAMVMAVDTDTGSAAAEWLSTVDARELHNAVMGRVDIPAGEHGLVQAMLTQLVEWATPGGRS